MKLGVLIATLVSFAAGELAEAKERLAIRVDHRSGLDIANVHAITQDSYGFIWIGTPGALFRFDGDRVQRWTEDQRRADGSVQRFRGEVWEVTSGLDGEVVFLNDDGAVYTVNADSKGYRPVLNQDQRPISSALDVSFDSRGRLWVVYESFIGIRSVAGVWSELRLGSHRRRNLTPGQDGSMWFATTTAVWAPDSLE